MSKYEPLRVFLADHSEPELVMTFSDIEKVIDQSLPPVAYRHRAWWSNNPANSVITRAWLDSGYKTERVDMGERRLIFRRTKTPQLPGGAKENDFLQRIWASLGGTVQFRDDVDLTQPTGEIWDAERT